MLPNKLNIAKWIVALRSGLYQQAKSTLRNSVGYCCLGVACEISKIGFWKPVLGSRSHTYTDGGDYGTESSLPSNVRSWLGLELSNPLVASNLPAISANDEQGWSFAQIADGLEALYLDGKKAEDIVRIARAEPDAWLVLAEAHDADLGSTYLCNTLSHPDSYGASTVAAIPKDVRTAMRNRIMANLDESGVAYDGENMTSEEEREGRVLACLMFAEIAADEVGDA